MLDTMFDDVPLLLAFTGGLIATVNPCGVAMLPAYLSFFLGLERSRDGQAVTAGAGQAIRVGATVAAGFLLVFGTAWVLLTAGLRVVIEIVPWAALVVGAVVLLLGVWMLLGRSLPIRLPSPGRVAEGRSTGAILTFGLGYAIASMSCTLPVFLAVVAGTATRVGVVPGMATFGVYAVGMVLPLLAITVALAGGRDALIRRVRRSGGVVTRAGGVLLVLAGLYIIAYWTAQLAGVAEGSLLTVVEAVEGAAASLANRIAARPLVSALVSTAIVSLALLVGRLAGRPAPGAERSADGSEALS
jgi:cytochrome c-type biogenesis protein